MAKGRAVCGGRAVWVEVRLWVEGRAVWVEGRAAWVEGRAGLGYVCRPPSPMYHLGFSKCGL